MGLKKTGNSGTWLNLKNGKFRLKTGEQTYEEFAILEGRITNIRFRDAEFQGKKWREVSVTLTDGKETYSFSVQLSSGYGRQMLYKLANANLADPVELSPTYSEEGAKKNAGMFVNQGGRPCKQKWTRDNPGAMPELKVMEFKGKKIYDDEAQLAFIEAYVAEHMIPQLSAASSSSSHEADEHGDGPGDDEHHEEDGSGIPPASMSTPF